jgi:hypothetical protein
MLPELISTAPEESTESSESLLSRYKHFFRLLDIGLILRYTGSEFYATESTIANKFTGLSLPVLSCFFLSYIVSFLPILFLHSLSCFFLSYLVSSFPILFLPFLSCLFLSYLVSSFPILFLPFLSCFFLSQHPGEQLYQLMTKGALIFSSLNAFSVTGKNF